MKTKKNLSLSALQSTNRFFRSTISIRRSFLPRNDETISPLRQPLSFIIPIPSNLHGEPLADGFPIYFGAIH